MLQAAYFVFKELCFIFRPLMCKFQFKLFVVIFFILFEGQALAYATGIGGRFFGFGRNTAEVSSGSPKDVLHERQTKKTAAHSAEKKAEIARNEQRKELSPPNLGDQKSASKKNRMTLDERRALRRQIHDASSEVYDLPK